MDVVLTSLGRRIIAYILTQTGPVTVETLAGKLGCTPRMIRYQMKDVMLWFSRNGVQLQRARKKGFWIVADQHLRQRLRAAIQTEDSYANKFSPEERQRILFKLLLCDQTWHSTEELMDSLGVRRTTLLEDMRRFRCALNRYGLTLIYVRGRGYRVSGSEHSIRQAMADNALRFCSEAELFTAEQAGQVPEPGGIVSQLVADVVKTLPTLDPRYGLTFLQQEIERVESQLGTRFTDTARIALVVHLAIAIGRVQAGNQISMAPEQLEMLKKEKHFAVARELAKRVEGRFGVHLPEAEAGYITLHLLGAKRFVQEPAVTGPHAEFLSSIALRMARAAEDFLGCRVLDEELLHGLMTHLAAAYYRVKYGLPIRNPLLEEIKGAYQSVYAAALRAGQVFSELAGLPFPEEEVGYIAMHIGAAMERLNQRTFRRKRIAVVCASGVGTASMLSAQIKSRFPEVEVVGTYSMLDLKKGLPGDIDAIVSTVPVRFENIPCVVVSPVLRFEDVNTIDNLLDLLPSASCSTSPFGDESPLSALRLTRSTIRFNVSCTDWKDAVKVAGQVLVDSGCCEKRYIDAMLRQIETYGSYMVFEGGLALPHARPSDGVIKPGISLVRLARGVMFPGEREPVKTIVALALTEKLGPQEIRLLKDLILKDKAQKIGEAKSLKELLSILSGIVVGA
ncbi:MAG TPA: PRD domain-containing protein [Firmicutes bacterium]|nr:PRD domain-containing protein [Candidatus Fermentithermobacillaceae bacterium]